MDGTGTINRLPVEYRFWPGERVRILHGELTGLTAVVSRIITGRHRLLTIESEEGNLNVIMAVDDSMEPLLERD